MPALFHRGLSQPLWRHREAPALSYALGYYDRDNAFYKEWDTIARDRDTFAAWLNDNFFEKGVA